MIRPMWKWPSVLPGIDFEKTHGQSEDRERITHAVRRALSRDPSDREIKVLLRLLNEQSERLKSDSSIAKSLLTGSPD